MPQQDETIQSTIIKIIERTKPNTVLEVATISILN